MALSDGFDRVGRLLSVRWCPPRLAIAQSSDFGEFHETLTLHSSSEVIILHIIKLISSRFTCGDFVGANP